MGENNTTIKTASGEMPKKYGNKRKKQIKKIVIWTLVIVAVLIFLGLKSGFLGKKNAVGEDVYNTYTVSRRTIQKTLTGTGTLEPYDSYTVSALSSGEILEDYFEEGDEVTEDQLLMKIDASNLETSLDRAQTSYDNAKKNLDDLYELREDLNVTSDYSGVIQVMNFEIGDEIAAGTVVASIIDRDVMCIDLPFVQEDTFSMSRGDTAYVTVGDTLETLVGTIEKISPVYTVNESGVKIVNVKISVHNPGGITERTSATAKTGNFSSSAASNFYYNVNEQIKSEVSGEVVRIIKGEGSYVREGETVLLLESESLEDNIKKAEDSLNDAENSLEDAKDAFDNYEITAPISGTVIEKNYKKGEKISMGAGGGSTVAVIYDLSALKFNMNIDELDIDALEVGQKVSVTSDAKSGSVYTGEITNISVQGTTQNGTTYYPITVTLENYGSDETGDKLRPGMNIDAEIIIKKVENVVAVPVDAVGRGNKVKLVSAAAESEKQQEKPDNKENTNYKNESVFDAEAPQNAYSTVPKNTKYTDVMVEKGISDENYVEIKSGLNDGDVVIVESNGAYAGNSFMNMMGNMSMGMGGMGQGGMSMGGMNRGPGAMGR